MGRRWWWGSSNNWGWKKNRHRSSWGWRRDSDWDRYNLDRRVDLSALGIGEFVTGTGMTLTDGSILVRCALVSLLLGQV